VEKEKVDLVFQPKINNKSKKLAETKKERIENVAQRLFQDHEENFKKRMDQISQ
jgi:hypothetical protein